MRSGESRRLRTSCASPDLTVLHRVEAVRVPGRLGISYADIARGRPMLVHSATAFESDEVKTRALSFSSAPWFQASGVDPMSIVRAP